MFHRAIVDSGVNAEGAKPGSAPALQIVHRHRFEFLERLLERFPQELRRLGAIAPPEPPSPITQATVGTSSRAIAACERAIAPPWLCCSAATPGYAPGMSTRLTRGKPCRPASSISRIALR